MFPADVEFNGFSSAIFQKQDNTIRTKDIVKNLIQYDLCSHTVVDFCRPSHKYIRICTVNYSCLSYVMLILLNHVTLSFHYTVLVTIIKSVVYHIRNSFMQIFVSSKL